MKEPGDPEYRAQLRKERVNARSEHKPAEQRMHGRKERREVHRGVTDQLEVISTMAPCREMSQSAGQISKSSQSRED